MCESCLLCVSHVSYVWVMSRMYESWLFCRVRLYDVSMCVSIMSFMCESCFSCIRHVSYVWVMSLMCESCLWCVSHVSYVWVMSLMRESCLLCVSHVSYVWVMDGWWPLMYPFALLDMCWQHESHMRDMTLISLRCIPPHYLICTSLIRVMSLIYTWYVRLL